MSQVYFEEIEQVVSSALASADRRIYIAVAWFTNNVLFGGLKRALDKKVEVKILIMDDILNRCEFGLDFGDLAEKGAEIRLFNSKRRTMHNKFCVIDDKVITGSYNWTYHANINHENIVVIDEPGIANSFSEQFENLFEDSEPIKMPYEKLKWTDIKSNDFTELKRSIYRDIDAKNDINKDNKKAKLIEVNSAYQSKDDDQLRMASQMPVRDSITIMDVLVNNYSIYENKLWEENDLGTALNNVSGYDRFCKWFYRPYELMEDKNHREYIRGDMVTYNERKDPWVEGVKLKIYDEFFIDSLKGYLTDAKTYVYGKIPKNILCIEYAKMCFYKFPSPMYHRWHPQKWRNGEDGLIPSINLFSIAKEIDGDNVVFYEGWDPNKRGEIIQQRNFSGSWTEIVG